MCTRINKNQTWPKTLIVEVEQKTRRPLSSAINKDSDNLCIGSFLDNRIGICSCFGGTGSANAFLCSSNEQQRGKLCSSSIWGEPSVGIVFKWSLLPIFQLFTHCIGQKVVIKLLPWKNVLQNDAHRALGIYCTIQATTEYTFTHPNYVYERNTYLSQT